MHKKFKFPELKEQLLKNGVRLIQIPALNEGVSIMVSFAQGRYSDLPKQSGCASLYASMVLKGPKKNDTNSFSRYFEEKGAALFADVTDERIVIGCRMLSRFANDLLQQFALALTNPAFDSGELATLKKEYITALQSEIIDPTALAHRCFAKSVFGKDHPAGRNVTIRSIKSLTSTDLKKFHEVVFSSRDTIVVIAGDVNHLEINRLSEFCAAIPDKNTPLQFNGELSNDVCAKKTITVVDKPDLTQSTLLVGYTTCGEFCEERLSLSVANYIFGGGNFSSRLMDRIRCKEGSTYGVSSQFVTNRWFGIVSMTTATQNAGTTKMLSALLEEHELLVNNGVTENELLAAQKYASGSMAFELEGISNISEKILYLRSYGRSNDYVENFGDMVFGLTCEKIQSAMKQYFAHRSMSIVVVGNGQTLKSQLADFGDVNCIPFRQLCKNS